jgi:hypothetical protein
VAFFLFGSGDQTFGISRFDEITLLHNQFKFSRLEGNGTYIFSGKFDSNTHAFGKVTFPRGYSVGTSFLTEDLTFEWDASPEK